MLIDPWRCPICEGFMARSDWLKYGQCFPCHEYDASMRREQVNIAADRVTPPPLSQTLGCDHLETLIGVYLRQARKWNLRRLFAQRRRLSEPPPGTWLPRHDDHLPESKRRTESDDKQSVYDPMHDKNLPFPFEGNILKR